MENASVHKQSFEFWGSQNSGNGNGSSKNITTEHFVYKLVVFVPLLCFAVVGDVHCAGCFISSHFISFHFLSTRTRHIEKFYTISFYLKCIIYYYICIHISRSLTLCVVGCVCSQSELFTTMFLFSACISLRCKILQFLNFFACILWRHLHICLTVNAHSKSFM